MGSADDRRDRAVTRPRPALSRDQLIARAVGRNAPQFGPRLAKARGELHARLAAELAAKKPKGRP